MSATIRARRLVVSTVFIAAVLASVIFSAGAQAAPGDLDPTFSGDGKQTTDLYSGSGDEVNDVAIQSDGKIVVVGHSSSSPTEGTVGWTLARYNPNGTLDTTFSGDGKQLTDFTPAGGGAASGVAIQSDGKIVVVGQIPETDGFALARYNPDGSLDPSFSGDGMQALNGESVATEVAIQADGKIVAVGTCCGFGGEPFLIRRFRPNGSLDPTFSGDGTQTTHFGDGDPPAIDVANGVAIQANGKIVAVGYTTSNIFIDPDPDPPDFALARYNPTGALDTTFSGDGKQTTDFSGAQANDVAIQSDGKIVAVGYGSGHFALTRYTPNGSLDSSFSADGKRATDFNGRANAVAIQANGKIVVAGEASGGATGSDFALARYNANGSLDTSFSAIGKRRTHFGGEEDANGVAIQTNGRIVAAGVVDVGPPRDFALGRYLGG